MCLTQMILLNSDLQYFILGTTRFPRLDISFVVSTTTVDADDNLKLIKSTIESIIEQYGVKKHLYSMVVFGQNANVILPFQKTTQDSLLFLIKGAQPPRGSPDLVRALETTKQLFFLPGGGARPDSRKIVVVMIDRKSTNSGSAIEKIVGELEDGKVRFVTVVIGNEANPDELIPLTPDKDKEELVPTDKDGDPKTVGRKIMAIIALGKYSLQFFFLGCNYLYHYKIFFSSGCSIQRSCLQFFLLIFYLNAEITMWCL